MERFFTTDELITRASVAHARQGLCHDAELRQVLQGLGATPAQIEQALSQSKVGYGDFDTILARCRQLLGL